MNWKPIEKMVSAQSIWILKYDIFFYPEGHEYRGNFCGADIPGAQKSTSCHGWYESEADALKVLNHFPKPNSYRIEKVHKRELLS